MKSKVWIVLAIFVLAIVIAFASLRPAPVKISPNQSLSKSDPAASKLQATSDGGQSPAKIETIVVEPNQGGIDHSDAKSTDPKSNNPSHYGVTQPVKGDANLQVRSVVEALQGKKNPERLSPLIPPRPFDPEDYKKNRASYLGTVEPGRCFQSKQPGKGVLRIQSISPQLQEVAQGQSVELKVKAPSGFPVTFTSFDLGRFENELTSITVEADESGVAKTRFFGASGTINEVNILASAPMASGQVKFMVNVTKQLP